MLDLKTVKEIKISEGSVTKITNSSGVVLWQKVVAPSASLDVDLNNQWVASTKKLEGYNVYMSNSNKGVDSGYASMKFKFKGIPDFKIWINSYAESSYDYTVAWNLDVDFPSRNPSYSSSGVKAHTSGKQYNPTSISNFTEVDYANDGGEHFVVVTYRKDSSVNANDDRGYVAVKLTLISTTWVVSSTEFVKKDDKYYQRLDEVGTYEGGVTALTGNYKEGNELPVTYKQGSADDYMITDGKMYYKNYIYVTPKDQEINTGDYVQGDYIGEATPSMKVTYTDNTEKTFYNLTSIDENIDPNQVKAKSVEIGDSVTTIGNNAFRDCSSLTGITIPNTVTKIEYFAFYGCSKLTGITIPSGVTRISDSVFRYCSSLESVTIPNGVTSIGNYAFQSCSNLTSITIPSGVTSIEYNTFDGCSKLTVITIPSGVTSIGERAFQSCSNLESVTIENSASKLTYSRLAFDRIASSAKLYVPSNLLSEYQADSGWTDAFKGGIYAIGTIPAMKVTYTDGTTKYFANLTSIEQDTIPNKANAKEVIIYDGVTSIDRSVFYNCENLTGITIPNSVTSIGGYTFYGCKSLTGITIPNSVTSIGDNAFYGCKKLTGVTIPNSVTSIGGNAFQSCTSLTSIAIGNGITNIGNYAFNGCDGLTEVTIPNSVTEIGNDAFSDCSGLTSVTIGNSVTSIGNYAFISDDGHLKYITVQASTPPSLGIYALPDELSTIYVPASSVDTYKSATNWSAFASKIKAIGS